MSTAGLFVMGVAVSLITVAALALLIYAAILDGRYGREHADVVSTSSTSREPDLWRVA